VFIEFLLLVYLCIEQGGGRGLGQHGHHGEAQAEGLVQQEEGTDDARPQAVHPVDAVWLQAERQIRVQTVVSE